MRNLGNVTIYSDTYTLSNDHVILNKNITFILAFVLLIQTTTYIITYIVT